MYTHPLHTLRVAVSNSRTVYFNQGFAEPRGSGNCLLGSLKLLYTRQLWMFTFHKMIFKVQEVSWLEKGWRTLLQGYAHLRLRNAALFFDRTQSPLNVGLCEMFSSTVHIIISLNYKTFNRNSDFIRKSWRRKNIFFPKMSLTLYATHASGPCRMVTMTLEFCGKEYNYKHLDLMKGDQNDPEYLKVMIFRHFTNHISLQVK